MMNRKQKILERLTELCKVSQEGVTTAQLAEQLKISRPNVSSDLNQLIREGYVVKTNNRPVHYFYSHKTEMADDGLKREDNDPFRYLIGYNGSLKKQVSQAKAAVIYPPDGLHTLLTGDTGVGKSLFASLMYNYAIYEGRLAGDAAFIVFNCADYASNPQLLVSHIFGYAKGAFTGASADKLGLISEADHGMLFLDEVHRLPPEGQEMIFYFMDTGTYGLLGETKRTRKASIFLICATTEDPGSVLLSTFLRRIPIKINLPNLSHRAPKDQVELLRFLLELEAKRLNRKLSMDPDCAKAILGSSFSGNVGKLKTTLQSVCAQFFIDNKNHGGPLVMTFAALPSDIKIGIFNLPRDGEYLAGLQRAIGDMIVILPDDPHSQWMQRPEIDVNRHDTPFQVYDFIDNKIEFMLEQNFSDNDINRYITSEINNYISCKLPFDRDQLDHGLDQKTLFFCQSIKNELEMQSGKQFSEGFLLSLGYHLDNLIKNISQPRTNIWTRRYQVNKLEEYESALTVKKRLASEFNIVINQDEVAYLTIMLASLSLREREKYIHVIVATHGDNIASNMVDIAKKLLAENNISAVDMPLDIRPNQAIEQIKKKISETLNTQGILLLVDMGSLLQAGEIISQDCHVALRTLDMVSTPLVIEALRRTVLLNADLDDIYYGLQHFRGYGCNERQSLSSNNKPLAVLAICSSGEGIAKKLQVFLRSVLDEMGRREIDIINLSMDALQAGIHNLLSEYHVLLSVGVVNPDIDIPHIPLSQLFLPQGELAFQTIIGGYYPFKPATESPITLTKLSEQYLQEFLVFLNPQKVVPIVMTFINDIRIRRHVDEFNLSLLNICVHICLALERSLRNEPIDYNKQNREQLLSNPAFGIYQSANRELKERLDLDLAENELLYVMDMLEMK
ncbi:sigma 54-interacting transcriptional regulator [Acerihabitans sp. KWT182]|uniref:Sigma 54-interacting transcriptional regulator n=1 Tax=Acerihabitans sp. KWT182 TaxID=3157919 RepID=A0AAU7QDD7_9GAMM